MVVMNPDDISSLPVLDNLVCKGLVDLDIILPRMILIGFTFGIVRDLIMENRPEDLLAEMTVVAVKVLVGAEDSQHIMLGRQSVLNILSLLGTLEGIGWHSQGAYPHILVEVIITGGGLSGVAKASIALVRIYNTPMRRGKDLVVAFAADERSGLNNAATSKLLGLLHGPVVLEDRSGRRGVGARLWLICAATPGR